MKYRANCWIDLGVVAAVAFPVVGISLVIGGIVIMNIMLASVTEAARARSDS